MKRCLKNVLILSVVITTSVIYSQNKHYLEAGIDLIGLDLSYERNLNNKFSIKSSLGYNGSIYRTNENIFVLQPNIIVQPRFYYNKDKRNSKGKNTDYNSANFISLNLEYLTSELNISNAGFYEPELFTIGTGWNLRRRIKSTKFVYEFSTGIVYNYNINRIYSEDDKLKPYINFRLSYILN